MYICVLVYYMHNSIKLSVYKQYLLYTHIYNMYKI